MCPPRPPVFTGIVLVAIREIAALLGTATYQIVRRKRPAR
jgi:hypothetical protein